MFTSGHLCSDGGGGPRPSRRGGGSGRGPEAPVPWVRFSLLLQPRNGRTRLRGLRSVPHARAPPKLRAQAYRDVGSWWLLKIARDEIIPISGVGPKSKGSARQKGEGLDMQEETVTPRQGRAAGRGSGVLGAGGGAVPAVLSSGHPSAALAVSPPRPGPHRPLRTVRIPAENAARMIAGAEHLPCSLRAEALPPLSSRPWHPSGISAQVLLGLVLFSVW